MTAPAKVIARVEGGQKRARRVTERAMRYVGMPRLHTAKAKSARDTVRAWQRELKHVVSRLEGQTLHVPRDVVRVTKGPEGKSKGGTRTVVGREVREVKVTRNTRKNLSALFETLCGLCARASNASGYVEPLFSAAHRCIAPNAAESRRAITRYMPLLAAAGVIHYHPGDHRHPSLVAFPDLYKRCKPQTHATVEGHLRRAETATGQEMENLTWWAPMARMLLDETAANEAHARLETLKAAELAAHKQYVREKNASVQANIVRGLEAKQKAATEKVQRKRAKEDADRAAADARAHEEAMHNDAERTERAVRSKVEREAAAAKRAAEDPSYAEWRAKQLVAQTQEKRALARQGCSQPGLRNGDIPVGSTKDRRGSGPVPDPEKRSHASRAENQGCPPQTAGGDWLERLRRRGDAPPVAASPEAGQGGGRRAPSDVEPSSASRRLVPVAPERQGLRVITRTQQLLPPERGQELYAGGALLEVVHRSSRGWTIAVTRGAELPDGRMRFDEEHWRMTADAARALLAQGVLVDALPNADDWTTEDEPFNP